MEQKYQCNDCGMKVAEGTCPADICTGHTPGLIHTLQKTIVSSFRRRNQVTVKLNSKRQSSPCKHCGQRGRHDATCVLN